MKILRVKKTNIYDVFCGLGWKNHSRIVNKDGHISLMTGKPLTKIQYVEISKTIQEVK